MGVISGVLGSVTYATGYTVNCGAWNSDIIVHPQDITPLAPTGGQQVVITAGNLRSGRGVYTCKLPVLATALMTGPYVLNPEEFSFHHEAALRDVTPLGAAWKVWAAKLLTGLITQTAWIDDGSAAPLPVLGATGTALLTLDTGKTYSSDYVVSNNRIEKDIDNLDSDKAIIEMMTTGALTPVGGVPVAGSAGSATFVAAGGRQLTGNIIIGTVDVRVNRKESTGSIEVGFNWTGAVTGA